MRREGDGIFPNFSRGQVGFSSLSAVVWISNMTPFTPSQPVQGWLCRLRTHKFDAKTNTGIWLRGRLHHPG